MIARGSAPDDPGPTEENDEAGDLHPLLAEVFAALDAAGVRWLVLRDGTHLADPEGDVDLLVARPEWDRARAVALANGFLPLRTWGRGSHRFLIGYHEPSDSWVRLDVVLDLRFGPAQELRLVGAAGMLARRVRLGDRWLPAPEDAFWALLLHVLLDRGGDAGRHAEPLERFAGTSEARGNLASALAERCPALDLSDLVATVAAARWADASSAAGPIREGLSRGGTSALGSVADRVLRRATRLLLLRSRGMTLALLGPDGSGKSSLAASLRERFAFPVVPVYMGMHRAATSSARGERPLPLPVRIPRQWIRYLRAQVHMTRGRLVVFDRYAHDALLATRGSALRRIGRGTLARSLPAPDLTLVLDAPAEVLAARRPGTSLDVLAQRRRGYLELARREGFGVVDATDPPGQMRRRVTARVWRTYLDRAERRSR